MIRFIKIKPNFLIKCQFNQMFEFLLKIGNINKSWQICELREKLLIKLFEN